MQTLSSMFPVFSYVTSCSQPCVSTNVSDKRATFFT